MKKNLKNLLSLQIGLLLTTFTFADTRTEDRVPGNSSAYNATFVSIGPGLALLDGNMGWSANAGALAQVGNGNILLGGDLAANFWNFSSPTATPINLSENQTGVQLLGTAVYRFLFAEEDRQGIYPYLGFSAGPNILTTRYQRLSGEVISQTDLNLEVLIRVGIFARVASFLVFQIEPKFGLLGSRFIFLPQANLVVAL